MVFRNIKINFHKILTGYGFYICVMFTTFLCFFTNIYEDYGNGNSYSVISSIMNFKRDFMLNDTAFCSFEIMQKGAGSWLSLFIPIISAFAFVPLVCDEYETKSVRFEIFRSSKREYFMAKFLSAGFCGGLAVMMGFALFVLIEFTLFPNIIEYETALRSMYEEELGYRFPDFARSGYAFLTAKKMGEMFLYGTFCAVPGIILTSIMHNKYLVMCIPFFLKYGLNQTCVRIQSNAIKKLQICIWDF
ncbi:MAG: hypothetical protein LUI39_06550 [Lachnospiraceae bacterium]|nr:hypothetical protein [Lachnospiraceae bacterium]